MGRALREHTWSKEKLDAFIEAYPHYTGRELASMFCICHSHVLPFAKRLGIPTEKTPECKERSIQKRREGSRRRFSSMSDEDKKKLGEKMQEGFRRLVKSERRRLLFGLDKKTNIKVCINPKEAEKRSFAKARLVHRRGYMSERGSRILYYDEETKRSRTLEERYKRLFEFVPADGFNPECSVFKEGRRCV